jgi:hypothetical protein
MVIGEPSSRGEVNPSVKYRISGRISLAAHSTGIRSYSSQTGMLVKDVVVLSLMARVCMRFFLFRVAKRTDRISSSNVLDKRKSDSSYSRFFFLFLNSFQMN